MTYGEYRVPESWAWAKLEDIGSVTSGGTPSTGEPDNFEGDVAWITPADLTNYRKKYIQRGERNLSSKGLASSSAKLLPKGTVLFSSRAPIGYVVISADEVCTNQGFKNLTPFRGIDSEYVYYYLMGNKRLAESMASGTTFLELSARRFSRIPIPVAPYSEQQRIVSKIEELFSDLDAGELSLQKARKLLVTYRHSVLKAAFTGELIDVDGSGWEETRLKNLIADIHYGTAKKCSRDDGKTPVLRIPNVVTGKIDLTDLKYADFNHSELDKLALVPGDLLIVRSNGSASLVARSAVVGAEAQGFAYAGYLIRLRLNPQKVLPEFLHLYFHSPVTRNIIEAQARSTSGVHNINSDEVRNLSLRLPPLNKQEEIVDKVAEIFSQIDTLETWCTTELKRSSTLRQSILKAAFSGELVPQEQTDEPASELLERLRTMREGTSTPHTRGRQHKDLSEEEPTVPAEPPATQLKRPRGRPRKNAPAPESEIQKTLW